MFTVSASDSDSFAIIDTAKSQSRKRRARQPPPQHYEPKPKRVTGRLRKVVSDSEDEESDTNSVPNDDKHAPMKTLLPTLGHLDLGNLRLVVSEDTPLLNKWLEALPKLSVEKTVKSSENEAATLTPLGDMPDMPHRDFKFKVELVDLFIKWGPQQGDEQVPTKLTTPQQKTV
ncbi:hypothetical protein FB567DRAFT_593745 [Paraphoma chrysanthemicola]|uniref:Uncharacterized protein n=1 Tax=Paraphoma chrysanthemicola TaxID=798071 RepID=A0A8K0VWY3_9PLEO|nr:hypothetical protein FB567DRAFT_593745 [Paraphoma chrysanthemicola]